MRLKYSRREKDEFPCMECGKGILKKGKFIELLRGKYLIETEGYMCSNCSERYFDENQMLEIEQKIRARNGRRISIGQSQVFVLPH